MAIKLTEEELKIIGEIITATAEKLKTPTYYNCTFSSQTPLVIKGTINQENDNISDIDEDNLIAYIQDKTGFDGGQIKWILQTADEYYKNNNNEI